ncbi:MAG: DMT family transporter [Bryobacterales bacterium]|nr:DMT family transporter [Bryobacterales bacterium]
MRSLSGWLPHALLCIFWWGLFGFLAKIGSSSVSPRGMQLLFTLGALPLVLVILARFRWRVETDRRGVAYGIANGVFAALGGTAYFAAMARGEASLVGPVTSLFPFITVVLAVAILHEKLNRAQMLGLVCALASVWLLSE